MKSYQKFMLLAAGVLMFMAPSAFADGVVVFNGSYAFANDGYGIPPYGGTLNGQSAEFYCVDFSHDIVSGDTWNAVITPLTNTANYSSTYQYTGSNASTEFIYQEFAWLLTQAQDSTDQTAIAADQWAIWSLSGGSDPFTGADSASTLLADAQAAVDAGFTGQGWEILTPDVGSYGQEFMVQTPEPGAMALLGIGLCALFFVKRREWFGLRRSVESVS
ncbi:MAG: PEP-CTERM sorting domain-containing protein [Candidatus Acidiferrales bacterium]